jgi:hypothetical protein
MRENYPINKITHHLPDQGYLVIYQFRLPLAKSGEDHEQLALLPGGNKLLFLKLITFMMADNTHNIKAPLSFWIYRDTAVQRSVPLLAA